MTVDLHVQVQSKFIYLIDVLGITQEYFTHTTIASIMVKANLQYLFIYLFCGIFCAVYNNIILTRMMASIMV